MSLFQKDPKKNFGTSNYFRDKDNMRNAVNELRQEDRQKRIITSQLRRNIKKSLREGKSPAAFIDSAKALKIDPLKGGGLGMEASRANSLFEGQAIKMFEDQQKAQLEREQKLGQVTPTAGGQAGATPAAQMVAPVTSQAGIATVKPNEPNQFTASFTPMQDSFAGGGVMASPTTELGKMADEAKVNLGFDSKEFRLGLNKAIGQAKTPQEIAELRRVAKDSGISDEAFSRQVDQWNKKLNPNQVAKPDWAKDVEKDKTFKGQDMSRFIGMTREEARKKVMEEKVNSFMQQKNKEGAALIKQEQDTIKAENQIAAEARKTELDRVKQIEDARTQGLQDTFGTRSLEDAVKVFGERYAGSNDKTKALLDSTQNFLDSTTAQADKAGSVLNKARLIGADIAYKREGFLNRNKFQSESTKNDLEQKMSNAKQQRDIKLTKDLEQVSKDAKRRKFRFDLSNQIELSQIPDQIKKDYRANLDRQSESAVDFFTSAFSPVNVKSDSMIWRNQQTATGF